MSRERGRTTTTAERIKNFSHTTRSQPVSNIELNGATSCGSSVPTARRGPSTPTLGARRQPGTRAPPSSWRPPDSPLVELPKRSGGEAGQKNGGNKKKKKPKEENKTKRNGTEKKHTYTHSLAHSLALLPPAPTPHITPTTHTHPLLQVHAKCSSIIYIYIL